MVDVARQLLDELMGRNRNNENGDVKQDWTNDMFCQYYMVKFCPHDLFVNTRADLGACHKIHDEESKRMYEEAPTCSRKTQYQDEFLRFCSNMINEVDRKIQKGKQRLLLMNNKESARPAVSKQQEQINNVDAKIKKLLREAEEAGTRGDVDQAQGLMTLCDALKEEKDELIRQYENNGWSASQELAQAQEKQMEVCEVCGAFLIVGDAQQRIDDHLTGKQHLGYQRLRKAVEDMYATRRKEREEEEKRRGDSDQRQRRVDSGFRDRSERRRDDSRYKDLGRRREREGNHQYRSGYGDRSSRGVDHRRDRGYDRHSHSHRHRDRERSSRRRTRSRSRSKSE